MEILNADNFNYYVAGKCLCTNRAGDISEEIDLGSNANCLSACKAKGFFTEIASAPGQGESPKFDFLGKRVLFY